MWKNSYASSGEARVSLRVNGEEHGVVIDGNGRVARAGFNAPTVAPTPTDTGAGSVPSGYIYYAYAYASGQYPFVESAITAGGSVFPRSNPSPNAVIYSSGSREVSVRATCSPRGDVDTIFVYRTVPQPTSALALAQANAGLYFYVGSVANDPAALHVTYTDNNASDTGERAELDNFACPLFRFTVFDGVYWWGFGNTDFTATATLNGTDTITADKNWFSGRDGMQVKITGIDTGGFDGRGTYYFKATGPNAAQLFTTSDLSGTAETIAATGTATITIQAFKSTLYRSKRLNPFSWGRTTQVISASGQDVNFVSDTWAEVVGGGSGSAISLIPNERILKLDTESPVKSYALDLSAADSDQFMATKRTLDEAQSVGSHFTQFPMRLSSRQSVGTGVNAKSLQILTSDAQSQVPIGDNVIRTLRRLQNGDDAPHFFHGVFDYRTELNCWFVKTTDGALKCDTLIYNHAPTNSWGIQYFPGISATAPIFDPVTGLHYTLAGDESGRIGFLFEEDTFNQWGAGTGTYETAAVNGAIGPFHVSAIGTLAEIETTDGISTAVTTNPHVLTPGQQVFIGGTNGGTVGNYTIISTPTASTFTFQERNSTGAASSETGGAYSNAIGYDVPGTVIQNREEGANIWILYSVTSFSATYTPPYNELNVSLAGAVGINLDTGALETIDATALVSFMPSSIACNIGRYFNFKSPSKNKRLVEMWATLEDASPQIQYWRFKNQYSETIQVENPTTNTIVPNQDSAGLIYNQSVTYFSKSTPSTLLSCFGVQIFNCAYSAYRLYDITLKAKEA